MTMPNLQGELCIIDGPSDSAMDRVSRDYDIVTSPECSE